MNLDPEALDLLTLTRTLHGQVPRGLLPAAYLEGKTALRDLVVSHLRCSELEAEQIVDTLVSRGFVQFQSSPESEVGGVWRFHPHA